jgi:two-component system NtrC family sensor kinase
VPPVLADPNQLQQVLVNALLNALQASDQGQEVTVAVAAAEGRVRLQVADHGTGIAEGDRQRIFDPFFSTKPEGQGTGLGLSVSYGIVQRHGGEIQVESQPGEGTTVTIDLPAAEPAAPGDGLREVPAGYASDSGAGGIRHVG